jgi:protocatechuate 4,5-dioxygenase beta chain
MEVDHGLTVPLNLVFGLAGGNGPARSSRSPSTLCSIRRRPASAAYDLGKAIRRAVDCFPRDLQVVIFGTGGMSHQISGPARRA